MTRGLIFSLAVHGVLLGGMVALMTTSKTSDEFARVVDVEVGAIVVGKQSGRTHERREPLPVPVQAADPAAGAEKLLAPQAVEVPVAAAVAGHSEKISADLGTGAQQLSIAEYIQWVRAHNEAPAYPRSAKLRHEEGRTVVRVVVSVTGAVEQTTVEQGSGHELLDSAALAAVGAWRFPPFKSDVERLAVKIPFKFTLEDR